MHWTDLLLRMECLNPWKAAPKAATMGVASRTTRRLGRCLYYELTLLSITCIG